MNCAGELMYECRHCAQLFDTHVECANHTPCENAVEKAVREEREAVVRYLQRVSSDESWIDAQTAIPWIARGDHRK